MKNCNHCGKDYIPKKYDHKSVYCSEKCREHVKKKRMYARNPEFFKEKTAASRQKNRELVDSFKTKCSRCGTADKRVLDFHHFKGKKSKGISMLRNCGYSTAEILKELKKCKVLCANCHRIHHWEERNGILSSRIRPNRKGGSSQTNRLL